MQRERGEDHHHGRYASIYDGHYRAVLAYARRRTSDADDVVAETFLTAWRRLDAVPSGDATLPWLYGVARRVIANQRRGGRRRSNLALRLVGQVPPPRPGIEDGLVANETHQAVLAALAQLKADDQEVLRLVVWETLSHRQAAQVLGCAESAVAVKVHRARARLSKELSKGGTQSGQQKPRTARGWKLGDKS